MSQGKCIIFSAGSFEKCAVKTREEDLIIAVDGGLLACLMCNLVPDYCIGDFDSLDPMYEEQLKQYEEQGKVSRLPVMKDVTDTYAALQYGLEAGYREFELYGTLGGKRMEHSIANIQSLMFLKNHGANGILVGIKSRVMLLQNESMCIEQDKSDYVSVFSYGPLAEHVTIKNMKYEVEDVSLSNDYPLGISNEFADGAGYISVGNGTLLLVFTTVEN